MGLLPVVPCTISNEYTSFAEPPEPEFHMDRHCHADKKKPPF